MYHSLCVFHGGFVVCVFTVGIVGFASSWYLLLISLRLGLWSSTTGHVLGGVAACRCCSAREELFRGAKQGIIMVCWDKESGRSLPLVVFCLSVCYVIIFLLAHVLKSLKKKKSFGYREASHLPDHYHRDTKKKKTRFMRQDPLLPPQAHRGALQTHWRALHTAQCLIHSYHSVTLKLHGLPAPAQD